jgi:hypothetical protein
MNVCLIVCLYIYMYGTYINPHFWTDLNQTLHTSPHWSEKDRRVCMGPKLYYLFDILGPYSLGATAEPWAQDGCRRNRFPAIPLYPWFQLAFAWRHRHNIVADGGVIRGSLISVILAGVPLTSQKWRRSRRQSHPPQRRIHYSGGCSRHVTDITFNQATGPSATALYLLFRHLFLWRTGMGWDVNGMWTGSLCLQFGTSSDGKKVTKELQLYK